MKKAVLGVCFVTFCGLTAFGDECFDYVMREAKNGDAGCMALLGLYYEEGRAGELLPNRDSAIRWYSEAESKGHSFAAQRLKEIEHQGDSSAQDSRNTSKDIKQGLSAEKALQLSAEEKYGGKVVAQRLGSVRPETGVIYPYYSYTATLRLFTSNHGRDSDDLKVSSVRDDGIYVRGDNFSDTEYFVDTREVYVDNDFLRDGWYQCVGRKKAWSGTVFRFRRVELENGDACIEKTATSKVGKEFAEEFTNHLFGR